MIETYVEVKGFTYTATPHPYQDTVCKSINQGAAVWAGDEVYLPRYNKPFDHIGSSFTHNLMLNSNPQIYRNSENGDLVAVGIFGNSQWTNRAYRLSNPRALR